MEFNLENYPLIKDIKISDIPRKGATVIIGDSQKKYGPDKLALMEYLGREFSYGIVSVRTMLNRLEGAPGFNKDRFVSDLVELVTDGIIEPHKKKGSFVVTNNTFLRAGVNYDSARYKLD